jgi:hypothetical protein
MSKFSHKKNDNFFSLLIKNEIWILRIIFFVILIVFGSSYLKDYKYNHMAFESSDIQSLYNDPSDLPLPIHSQIPNDEDLTLLDKKLKIIFPQGWENLSEEKRALEIEKFIVSDLKLQNNLGTATKILQDGYSGCSGMAYSFKILSRRVGLQARYSAIFNTPGQGGHNLTEIYYDKGWHLFDPTFGVFVYSDENYDGLGHILSMQEVRKNFKAGFIQQIVDTPWLGNYNDAKTFTIKPVALNYLTQYNSQENQNFDIYWRNEIKSSFPVAYGTQNWVSQPINIDLQNSSEFWIGSRDNNPSDIDMNTDRFHGSSYLGKSRDTPGVYNTFNVKINTPQDIIVRYWTLEKNPAVNLNIVRLRGVQYFGVDNFSDHVDIRLRITDSPGLFMVILDKGIVVNDAIEIVKTDFN